MDWLFVVCGSILRFLPLWLDVRSVWQEDHGLCNQFADSGKSTAFAYRKNNSFHQQYFQGFWVVILFGKYVEYLYIARLLTGLGGGGIFSLIPTYVSEISEDRLVSVAMKSLSE